MNKFFLIFYLLILNFSVWSNPTDSVGVKREGNQLFTMHKVITGETLYAISRKYKCKPADIIALNPELASGLKIGLIIKILNSLSTTEITKETTDKTTIVESKPLTQTHTVEHGQSLYFISKKYNVSADDIKKWNNLKNNDLQIGMILTLHSNAVINSSTSSSTTKVETIKETSKEIPITTNPTENTNLPTQNKVIISEKLSFKLDTVKLKSIKINTDGIIRNQEVGIAEVNSEIENDKYIAYHRTCPIGSLIRLKSTVSNVQVFVKVIGRIPDKLDKKTIIITNNFARTRLKMAEKKFHVEISYIPDAN